MSLSEGARKQIRLQRGTERCEDELRKKIHHYLVEYFYTLGSFADSSL